MAYEIFLGVERLCTIKELARSTGLGAGTVHRVLKGHRSVTPEVAQRVLAAMDRRNRVKIARALAGASTVELQKQLSRSG